MNNKRLILIIACFIVGASSKVGASSARMACINARSSLDCPTGSGLFIGVIPGQLGLSEGSFFETSDGYNCYIAGNFTMQNIANTESAQFSVPYAQAAQRLGISNVQIFQCSTPTVVSDVMNWLAPAMPTRAVAAVAPSGSCQAGTKSATVCNQLSQRNCLSPQCTWVASGSSVAASTYAPVAQQQQAVTSQPSQASASVSTTTTQQKGSFVGRRAARRQARRNGYNQSN